MEHPDTHEELLDQILSSLKKYKPKRTKKEGLAVDLDAKRKRGQSKLVKMFREDSITRNAKILHEMIPQSTPFADDIEMTQINGDPGNQSEESADFTTLNQKKSSTLDQLQVDKEYRHNARVVVRG